MVFYCLLLLFSINKPWVITLKDKKAVKTINAFQKILKESNGKPYNICVEKGSEFYNRSMKSWLEKNATEMYSTHNEGKSIVATRIIRTLKNKMYKSIWLQYQKMSILINLMK